MDKTPIFSTEGLCGIGNVVFVVICTFIGAFIITFSFPEFSVVYWLLLIIVCIPFTRTLNMRRSYVKLYDDHITGYSMPKNNMSNGACEFHLRYSDITHINAKTNIVEIFFSGGSYLVQAKGVESKVVEMINTYRMQS